MKINQIKFGIILGYLQMALGIIVSLLYTPTMIRLLGQSEYGLYNTAASVISVLSMLSLGFSTGYIKFYSTYKKREQQENIYKLNGLYLIVFSIIGLIALASGFFLSENLGFIFDEGLTAAEYKTAEILMKILTVSLAISFPMTVFSNIITANERFVFLKSLSVVKTVLSPLVTLPLLLMGFRSIAMVSVSLAITLVTDLLYLFFVIFKLKNKFVFKGFEKGLFKSILVYTSFIAINVIVDQINLNVDKVLLARFINTSAVAVYSVAFTLQGYYQQFSTAINGLFVPRVHKIVNDTESDLKKRTKSLTEIFVKVGRLQYLVLALIASGLIFFGKPFINFWVGPGYENSYYIALLLIIPKTIDLIQNIGIEIQRAQNKHKFRSFAFLAMAIINLIISIYLCQIYGAIGCAIGTALSFVIANGFIINIYYHKKCCVNVLIFWKNILTLSRGMILPAIFGCVCCIYNFNAKYMIPCILIYALIYCISMYFMGMNSEEKNYVKVFINKFIKKQTD